MVTPGHCPRRPASPLGLSQSNRWTLGRLPSEPGRPRRTGVGAAEGLVQHAFACAAVETRERQCGLVVERFGRTVWPCLF